MLVRTLALLLFLSACSSSTEKPIALYSTTLGDDLTWLFVKAINRAEEKVDASFYGLTSPPLLSALQSRAQKGVQVDVISDARASRSATRYLSPPLKLTLRESVGLMHRKELFIDRRELWLGSANWTPHSLRYHGNLVIAIANERSVHELLDQGKSEIDGCSLRLWHLPEQTGVVEAVISAIRSATSTVKVAMFTFTNEQLASELVEAKQLGIDVQVVIESSSARGSGKKVIQQLIKGGVFPAISHSSALLHHKLCWIDEDTLITGSANWTKAAFTTNEEVVLMIHSLPTGEQKRLQKLWRAIWAESKEITLDTLLPYR